MFLKLQEESASPRFKAGRVKVKLEKKGEGNETHTVKEKEEESHSRKETSTSGSKFSMLRSFPNGEIPPSFRPLRLSHIVLPLRFNIQPPLFTLLWDMSSPTGWAGDSCRVLFLHPVSGLSSS